MYTAVLTPVHAAVQAAVDAAAFAPVRVAVGNRRAGRCVDSWACGCAGNNSQAAVDAAVLACMFAAVQALWMQRYLH